MTRDSSTGGPSAKYPIAPRWIGRSTKICSRCFKELPIEQFNWFVDNRLGTQRPKGNCIECGKSKSKGEYARKVARGQVCSSNDCPNPSVNLGLCAMHYRQTQREKYGQCIVEGCDKLQQDSGLCPMHKRRQLKFGSVGPPHPARWRNGKWSEPQRPSFLTDQGYRMVYSPENPARNSRGYVLEHRQVIAHIIGRELLPNENVHHINGMRSDNRPENLQLWVSSQPSGQRVEDVLAWAKSIIHEYQPVVESLDGLKNS